VNVAGLVPVLYKEEFRLNENLNIEDACMSEVLARVAFRYAEYCYLRYATAGIDVDQLLSDAIVGLSHAGFNAVSCFLSAMNYDRTHLRLRLGQARDLIVVRSRVAARNRNIGKPWRRVNPKLPPC
jgi:hypothetical protein